MRVAAILAAAVVTLSSGIAGAQVRSGWYGGGLMESLLTGQAPASHPVPRRAALQDDGTLPRHPAAYGYGGPDSPRLPADDSMAGYRQAYPQGYSQGYVQEPAAKPRYVVPAGNPYEQSGAIARAPEPRYARQVVPFEGRQRPGTIVIDTAERYLYLVQPGGQAIRYGIGVGRPGFLWRGVKTVSQKREWPDWTPPPEMMQRRPDLPSRMQGGPENPLGARALYLGSSLYRIHGTNEPHTIGQAVSSGCIRMMNEDVVDLYERAPVGTRVEVI